jgi:hypothetical protein
MAQLYDQSPEILHNIFVNVESTDLAKLSRTCKHFSQFITNDEFLWKLQYESRFVRFKFPTTFDLLDNPTKVFENRC